MEKQNVISIRDNFSMELIEIYVDGVLQVEKWLPVVGYEGLYEVSNFGRIKSLRRAYTNSIGRVHHTKNIILAQSISNQYRCVTLCNHIKKNKRVNVLVAQAFVPNPINKPQVNHKDGDKMNNTVWNLEWATSKENIRHSIEAGLKPKPENTKMAKLNEFKVKAIRRLFRVKPEVSKKAVADKLNMNTSTIYYILNKKLWPNI